MSDEQKPEKQASEPNRPEGELGQAHVNAIVAKETADLKSEIKRLRSIEKELADLKDKQLSEQERAVKEAIEKKTKELESAFQQKELDVKIEHAILVELHRRGLDPRFVHVVRGAGGSISTVEDAVLAVDVALKDLKTGAVQQVVQQGPNRGEARKMTSSGGAPITRSQLRDREFWNANRDRCMAAIRNNEILED